MSPSEDKVGTSFLCDEPSREGDGVSCGLPHLVFRLVAPRIRRGRVISPRSTIVGVCRETLAFVTPNYAVAVLH